MCFPRIFICARTNHATPIISTNSGSTCKNIQKKLTNYKLANLFRPYNQKCKRYGLYQGIETKWRYIIIHLHTAATFLLFSSFALVLFLFWADRFLFYKELESQPEGGCKHWSSAYIAHLSHIPVVTRWLMHQTDCGIAPHELKDKQRHYFTRLERRFFHEIPSSTP